MTQTARRLARIAAPHARARAAGLALAGAGAALVALAAGAALAPRAVAILAAWVVVALALAAGAAAARRAARRLGPARVAALAERAGNARPGAVAGLVFEHAPAGASAALVAAADARAADVVRAAEALVRADLARGSRRSVLLGGACAAAGAALFLASSPASARATLLWHPLRAVRAARSPVRLELDRTTVPRGASVAIRLAAPGATRAILWTRGAGEPWRADTLALDAGGAAGTTLGPLAHDLFLRASAGSRSSGTAEVHVLLPPFLARLDVTAHYPAYLGRPDEPIVPGADTIAVPEGTVLETRGELSAPLAGASWRRPGAVSPLAARGDGFSGRLVPHESGTWRLALRAASGDSVEGAVPDLVLRVVSDSAPVVALLYPSRDTTLPLSERLPLVVDARDDHALTRVTVVSWRASQTGKVGAAVRDTLRLGVARDRAILEDTLDATARGLIPGDTLRLYVEATDNAPTPHVGRSAVVALRLPDRDELRASAEQSLDAAAAGADSVARAARELEGRTADLAAQRARSDAGADSQPSSNGVEAQGPDRLPFGSAERAGAAARDQQALSDRVQQLAREVDQAARALQAAGVGDSALFARLAEVRRLLQDAVSPELARRLADLQAALEKLDPDAARAALSRLADAERQLREDLERSQELFRRAAVEGRLSTLIASAEDLARRQADWNRTDAPHPDSAGAARERALGGLTDSLAAGIEGVGATLGAPPGSLPPRLGRAAAAADSAARAMAEAAVRAGAADARRAQGAGRVAEQALADVPERLRSERDSLVTDWKQETLDALDRALGEASDLAARALAAAHDLEAGQGGAAVRARQASVEEGVTAVTAQVRAAAGRNALVSPQILAVLAFAQRQMAASRQALEQPVPDVPQAATLAGESVDALDAAVLALVRSAGAVSGAASGSGFAEAMEALSKLAQEQGGLNGDAQSLLPLAGGSAQAALLEKLRALAERQRALADALDRLHASGASDAAGALANEARDLARQLDQGRLDPQVIARQQRLYHRLLDAGRTLTGSREDETRERVSRAASPADRVLVPGALAPGATGAGPRLPYPAWDALQGLTPEERRAVLEYFRRINAPRP